MAATTLRGVAREVGLSAPAVQNFIDGAEPRRASTLRKLQNWYALHRSRSGDGTDVDAAAAAVDILTRDLAPSRRITVVEDLLLLLERGYQLEGDQAPQWLVALARRKGEADAEPS